MKIYKCIVSGDELFTDVYRMEKFHCFYRIVAAMTVRKDGIDESKLGSNPSAEEETEGAEDSAQSGINIVMDNRLVETGFGSKKDFQVYLKDFIKKMEGKMKEKNPDQDLTTFREEIKEGAKDMMATFKDLQFYQGETMNPEGHIAVVRWETPEGKTDEVPVFYFFCEGLIEEKA